MKRIPLILFAILMSIASSSCNDDENTWEKYSDWRNTNESWLQEQVNKKNNDGTPYYSKIVPPWDTKAYVLIRYLNDTTLTTGLRPMYTSTVEVKYAGYTCTGEKFDSSERYRTKCSNVIRGWLIALEQMQVGDKCEIVIPYQQAYNENEYGIIKPYSCLRFNIELLDIPYYEIRQ